MTTTRTEYVAVQVAGGGLWHAAEWQVGQEHARTLCGRTGWIDHDAYGTPIQAVAGLYGPDEAHMQQYVECRSCLRFMEREAMPPSENCSDCGTAFDNGSPISKRAAAGSTKCVSCRDMDIQDECYAE